MKAPPEEAKKLESKTNWSRQSAGEEFGGRGPSRCKGAWELTEGSAPRVKFGSQRGSAPLVAKCSKEVYLRIGWLLVGRDFYRVPTRLESHMPT